MINKYEHRYHVKTPIGKKKNMYFHSTNIYWATNICQQCANDWGDYDFEQNRSDTIPHGVSILIWKTDKVQNNCRFW